MEGTVECSTEYMKYKVDSNEKCLSIWAHPNFRGNRFPWYDDLAFIWFEHDDHGNLDDFPCCILSCVHRREHRGKESTFDHLVQYCSKSTGGKSVLFIKWDFSREFHVVSSTALLVSFYYVLFDGWELTDTVFVVKDRHKRASLFHNSIRWPLRFCIYNFSRTGSKSTSFLLFEPPPRCPPHLVVSLHSNVCRNSIVVFWDHPMKSSTVPNHPHVQRVITNVNISNAITIIDVHAAMLIISMIRISRQ